MYHFSLCLTLWQRKIFRMKNLLKLLISICVISIVTSASAASFDCAKAGTKVEKMICGSPELSHLDRDLAETYKDAVSKESSIRSDQMKWLKERNSCTNEPCLIEKYKDRISVLNDFIVRYDRSLANNPSQGVAPNTSLNSTKSKSSLSPRVIECFGIFAAHYSAGNKLLPANATFFDKYIDSYEQLIKPVVDKVNSCRRPDSSGPRHKLCAESLPATEQETYRSYNYGINQYGAAAKQSDQMVINLLRTCTL